MYIIYFLYYVNLSSACVHLKEITVKKYNFACNENRRGVKYESYSFKNFSTTLVFHFSFLYPLTMFLLKMYLITKYKYILNQKAFTYIFLSKCEILLISLKDDKVF